MTPQVAQLALKLLERATLNGSEVDVYTAVRQALIGVMQGSIVLAPPPRVAPAEDDTAAQEMLASR